MARQFRLLRHQPWALQLPYEGAQAAFNDTVEQIAGLFWPQVCLGCSRQAMHGTAVARAGERLQAPRLLVEGFRVARLQGSWWRAAVVPSAFLPSQPPPPPLPPPPAPQHAGRIRAAAQQCDPTSWSSVQITTNNHVTAAKHSAADRQRLQGVLAGQPDIRRHLCMLAEALGYVDDPRCQQQAAAGGTAGAAATAGSA